MPDEQPYTPSDAEVRSVAREISEVIIEAVLSGRLPPGSHVVSYVDARSGLEVRTAVFIARGGAVIEAVPLHPPAPTD